MSLTFHEYLYEYLSLKSCLRFVSQSKKIRTVVKTSSLWGPDKITQSVDALFTVNKKKHLLSLLTMVGPSPDWCLGMSGADWKGFERGWWLEERRKCFIQRRTQHIVFTVIRKEGNVLFNDALNT